MDSQVLSCGVATPTRSSLAHLRNLYNFTIEESRWSSLDHERLTSTIL